MAAPRVAALTSHPIQYQAPLFRELEEREDIDLTVYFCSDHGVEPTYDEEFGEVVQFGVGLLSGYSHTFLKNWSHDSLEQLPIGHLNPSIVREIRQGEFDLLWVHGWSDPTNWLAIAAANLSDTDVLIRGDTNGISLENKVAGMVRDKYLRALFRGVDKYGAVGTLNREFYLEKSVPESAIYETPYTVDNQWFQERKPSSTEIPKLRRKYGLDPNLPTVLFVGKLVEWKRPMLLLEAFSEIVTDEEAQLVFVGTGEMQDRIRAAASEYGVSDVVYTPGFVEQENLPHYYGIADIFCLPSQIEPWGLVINEALNFGLPIISSDKVGAAPDLVTDNGIIFESENQASLSLALYKLITDPDLRREMEDKSLELAEDWTLEATADGIVEAAIDAADSLATQKDSVSKVQPDK